MMIKTADLKVITCIYAMLLVLNTYDYHVFEVVLSLGYLEIMFVDTLWKNSFTYCECNRFKQLFLFY